MRRKEEKDNGAEDEGGEYGDDEESEEHKLEGDDADAEKLRAAMTSIKPA